MGVVCGRFETIREEVIYPPLLASRQLEPARIEVFPDRRMRYEEHLRHQRAARLESTSQGYVYSFSSYRWTAMADNHPPRHLRYQMTEHNVTYQLTIDLRQGVINEATGDSELFVDAVIETAGPVT